MKSRLDTANAKLKKSRFLYGRNPPEIRKAELLRIGLPTWSFSPENASEKTTLTQVADGATSS
jgi:hypothetical protein